jgi:hypothetical protein
MRRNLPPVRFAKQLIADALTGRHAAASRQDTNQSRFL